MNQSYNKKGDIYFVYKDEYVLDLEDFLDD